MKKYLVTITDVFEIEAPNEEQANDIASDKISRYGLVQEINEVEEF